MDGLVRSQSFAPETTPPHVVRSRWFFAALALAPAAAFGIAYLLDEDSDRRLRRSLTYAAGAALSLGVVRWQLARLFSEEPRWTLERQTGPLEIRRYPSEMRAVTRVQGPFREALDEGFRRLAGYIFGGNDAHAQISMTAPVSANAARGVGERLDMTAPVGARPKDGGFEISFTMPSERSRTRLPVPDDARVTIVEVPARRIAVLRSHGTFEGARVERLQEELLAEVERAGLHATSAPSFAGYDPPSTLPWLRRLEVWVDV